jgi:tetratricopeptide (TPR) repeat protein
MPYVDALRRLACLLAAGALLAACATPEPPPAAAPAPEPPSPSAVAARQAMAAREAARTEKSQVAPAVQSAFDAARQALAAGNVAEAERGFAALTRSNPELSGPHANLGLIHRQAGKSAEAVAELEKAVDLSPLRAELHSQLGLAYRMTGDFAKARAAYERAIALDAAYAPAVLNLGILHDLYLWDGERALEFYDRYMQLTPGGDEQVKRWISDLRNRGQKKATVPGKEAG